MYAFDCVFFNEIEEKKNSNAGKIIRSGNTLREDKQQVKKGPSTTLYFNNKFDLDVRVI